jgi:hypothetical protein
MFGKLFDKRAAREKWDSRLVWFRLRYLESEGPTRCIRLLSRSHACGRVALYYRPGEAVSQLYLGVPATYVRLLHHIAADFGFSLKPKPPEIEIPAAERLAAVADLPWDEPFVAHVTNEFAFASAVGDESKPGSYLPQPPSAEPGRGTTTWSLPGNPLPGLTAQPSWNGQQPPAHLLAAEPDSQCWLLGWSYTGIPLQLSGQVNIYGRRGAVAEWLTHQVSHMVAVNPANLVVIDGAGDLVPILKRKAAVTRLLGTQLAYVDIDGAPLVNGFNPLATVPGETDKEMVQRWQRWFQGMDVHPQSIQLLSQAQQGGVTDIPSLRKWLKQIERHGQNVAVSSLGMALNRLATNRTLREWLEWPTNRFEVLPEGALLFACKGTSWDRQQLLRAVFLATMQATNTRLIIHGFRWKATDTTCLEGREQTIVSNGPPLANSTIVLTESNIQDTTMLKKRFLGANARMGENLELLRLGEGIVVAGNDILFTTWDNRAGRMNHSTFGQGS